MNKDGKNVSSAALDTELAQAASLFSRTKQHRYELATLIEASQQSHEHEADLGAYDELLRSRLARAIFVGHINTDLDSVAGAIGLRRGRLGVSRPRVQPLGCPARPDRIGATGARSRATH